MSGRLRALIVDDEPLAVRRLQIAIEQLDGIDVAGVARDGAAAVALVQTIEPDLIFLDVKMPILNGLDALARIPPDRRPAVIFVTAFSRFAVKAFEAAAVDYLLKPVEFGRLREAIERAKVSRLARDAHERIGELLALVADLQTEDAGPPVAEEADEDLWIADRRGAIRVPLKDVEMFAAEGDYVQVYATSRSHLLKERLRVLEARLGGRDFIRVHRSALIRISAIERFETRRTGGLQITLRSGRIVPVGRSFETAVRRIWRPSPS